MCHKAILIMIMKIKRTAEGTHSGSVMLAWSSVVGEDGRRREGASFLGLGFSIPEKSTEIDSFWSRHSGLLSNCLADVHTAIL